MEYGKEWLNIANAALSMVSSHLLQEMDDGSVESSYVETLLPTAVEDVYSTLDFYSLSISDRGLMGRTQSTATDMRCRRTPRRS